MLLPRRAPLPLPLLTYFSALLYFVSITLIVSKIIFLFDFDQLLPVDFSSAPCSLPHLKHLEERLAQRNTQWCLLKE